MTKERFTILQSTAVPLPTENIDTDQIIPARFLKATTREGFGDNLFRDWRYDGSNHPVSNFVLNDPKFRGKILVAGKNFGCGSSREHAAWSLYDHGFRAVISSFFADIFKSNALNNGLLPVTVSETFLQQCFDTIDTNPSATISIDLKNQQVKLEGGPVEKFEINAYKKECLMNGYDDIDYLLSLRKTVRKFDMIQGKASLSFSEKTK